MNEVEIAMWYKNNHDKWTRDEDGMIVFLTDKDIPDEIKEDAEETNNGTMELGNIAALMNTLSK